MATKKAASAKKTAAEKKTSTEKLVTTKEVTFDSTGEILIDQRIVEQHIEQAPNVIWSSEKNEDDTLKFGDPPPFVRVGMLKIEVPEAAVQLKGFYSEHARLLVQSLNGYKRLQPKG